MTYLENLASQLQSKFTSKGWHFECSQMSQEELSGESRQVCQVFSNLDSLTKVAQILCHSKSRLEVSWHELSDDEKHVLKNALETFMPRPDGIRIAE